MSHITWVVVADSNRAKFYSIVKARLFNGHDSEKELSLIDEYTHEESRLKRKDLVSDKAGSFGGSNFAPTSDPKQKEEDKFAHELADLLHKAHLEKKFVDVILIAQPTFMGMLNSHLPNDMKKAVSLRLEKDYIHASGKELVKHLKENI